MNKSFIFWDFDGVMADSTTFVFSYWQAELAKAGHNFQLADYQATFAGKFPFDYLRDNYPDCAEQIFQSYSTYEAAHYHLEVEPYAGFINAFAKLPPQYEHAVVSANLRAVIEPWLQRHNLADYFSVIKGREDSGHKDEKICHIMAEKSLTQSECIFIGDTLSDMNHAKAAGVESIAVTWGVHSKELLTTAQPHHMCHTIEELFTLLQT